MTAIISHSSFGTSAFIENDTGLQIAMLEGNPCVEWSFRIKQLEDWLTTLEQIIPEQTAHRYALEGLYFSLKAAHKRHEKQHNEIVTDAPTGDDLMSYLVAYSAAMACEAMEENK